MRIAGLLFSIFLVISFTFAANLSTSLSLSDSTIAVGDSITLTATISGEDSSVQATLTNSEIGDALTVSPWQGDNGESVQSAGTITTSTSVSWTISADSAGDYDLQVVAEGSGATSDAVSVTLTVSDSGFVQVSSRTCSPTSGTSVSEGDILTMSYSISNSGGASSLVNTSMTSNYASISSGPNGTSESDSETIDGGDEVTHSWVYAVGSPGTSDRTVLLSPEVSAGSNDPTDPSSCSYTLTGTGESGDSSSTDTSSTTSTSSDTTVNDESSYFYVSEGRHEDLDMDMGEYRFELIEVSRDEYIIFSMEGKDYTLLDDSTLKIDLDDDGYYDIEFEIERYTSNNRVKLNVWEIHESYLTSLPEDILDENTITKNVDDNQESVLNVDDSKEDKSYPWVYILLIIIVLVVGIVSIISGYYLTHKKKKKKSSKGLHKWK